MYNGENRNYGAHLTYYVKIDQTKKDAKKEDKKEEDEEDKKEENVVKWDSIHTNIYDDSRLIRTLKRKAPDSTGIYKWTWFMNEKGGDRPSRKIRKRKNEPGGVGVKPGTYKDVMTFGDQTSQEMIKVASDPRLKVSVANINQVYDASKELQAMRQSAADAVKQLIESKQIAETYQKDLKKLDKKKHKDPIKSSKDIVKKIGEIVDIYLGKEDKRQGITRNPEVTVMQRLGTAGWYTGSRQNGLTSTEKTLIQNAKDALKDALDKTNTFFNEEWKPYQTTMEAIKTTPFKEIKTFKID
jgi:hypothetical protein